MDDHRGAADDSGVMMAVMMMVMVIVMSVICDDEMGWVRELRGVSRESQNPTYDVGNKSPPHQESRRHLARPTQRPERPRGTHGRKRGETSADPSQCTGRLRGAIGRQRGETSADPC
eukprot:5732214-Pyramimonas_sp.AAC.1